MYGITAARVPGVRVRLDARYSTFQSAVAGGEYRSLSILKEIDDRIRIEVQGGEQRSSGLVNPSRSRFVITTMDWFVGRHVVVGFTGSRYRGGLQNYDQGLAQLGYRF
jgi:hypothetical protein